MAFEIRVQQVLLLVLQQGAAHPVHDALWSASGTGGVEDVQRVVEFDPFELEALRIVSEFLEAFGAFEPGKRRARVQVADHGHALDAWQPRDELRQCRPALELLARVGVAVDAEQHLRGDLPEALQQGSRAHVR